MGLGTLGASITLLLQQPPGTPPPRPDLVRIEIREPRAVGRRSVPSTTSTSICTEASCNVKFKFFVSPTASAKFPIRAKPQLSLQACLRFTDGDAGAADEVVVRIGNRACDHGTARFRLWKNEIQGE